MPQLDRKRTAKTSQHPDANPDARKINTAAATQNYAAALKTICGKRWLRSQKLVQQIAVMFALVNVHVTLTSSAQKFLDCRTAKGLESTPPRQEL